MPFLHSSQGSIKKEPGQAADSLQPLQPDLAGWVLFQSSWDAPALWPQNAGEIQNFAPWSWQAVEKSPWGCERRKSALTALPNLNVRPGQVCDLASCFCRFLRVLTSQAHFSTNGSLANSGETGGAVERTQGGHLSSCPGCRALDVAHWRPARSETWGR
jgi:hypothetical protein